MRYGICADFHGADLEPLGSALRKADIDVLVSLSDFDLTKTVHQFLEIKDWAIAKGCPVYEVPGNHDHAMLNQTDIYSPYFEKYDRTYPQLCDELHSDAKAKNYIQGLVDRGTRSEFWLGDDIRRGRVLVVHGGLANRSDMWTPHPSDLWNRIVRKADYKANFKEMERLGYRIMIRGHDHKPAYASQEPRGDKGVAGILKPFSEYRTRKKKGKGRVMLDDDKRYIINPGALREGHWAVIDVADKTFLDFCTL